MKVLPIGFPDITAYPHHAHLYAILNGIDKEENYKLPWLCNNYVQLEFESRKLDFSIGFDILPLLENCPWLIKDSISYELINKRWMNIIEFLRDAINADYYIYLEVDEYFIKEYDNYQKKHFSHTILIYGYDDSSREFYVSDFFKDRKYYFSKATFDEIEKGYENNPTTFLFGVFLLRKKENAYFKYEYSREGLIRNLEDFLYSKNTKERNMIINYTRVMPHVEESIFGINIFDAVGQQLLQTSYVPPTNLYVIKEHLKVLEIILLQLVKLGLVKDWEQVYCDLQEAYEISQLCISVNIKYFISKKMKLISCMYDLLQETKKREKSIIQQLIANIKEKGEYNIFHNTYFHATQTGVRAFNCVCKEATFYTINSTSYLQATFCGTGIKYVAEARNIYGQCIIYIDGNKYGMVSLKSDAPNKFCEVMSIEQLPYSLHTIRVQSNTSDVINLKYFQNIKSGKNQHDKQSTILRFVKYDRKTMGNWKGQYGSQGYVLPGIEWKYPIYGDVVIQKLNLYVNSEIPMLESLLQSPENSDRINMCYYCDNQESVYVIVAGEKQKKVSLYLLDWGQTNKIQCRIIVRQLETQKVIDARVVENMEMGVYLTYELLGAYEFVIKYNDLKQEREYGDFYGLFFD